MSYRKRFSDMKAPEQPMDPAIFLHEESLDCNRVQRNFIGYMARRLRKLLPLKDENECAVLVIGFVGEQFRKWFVGMAEVEMKVDFYSLYGKPEGPERIFREIFPNQTVEEFLHSCLNGSDGQEPVSARGETVRRDALNSIKQP